jgi:arylsulfatase
LVVGWVGWVGAHALGKWPALACTVNQRPSIVYILADDLGYANMNAHGANSTAGHVSNINQPAKQDLGFTNAVSASSVCSPTR